MLKIGDVVAIRGDLRTGFDGGPMYTSEQLIRGKYLKHTTTGAIWLGRVDKVDEKRREALVGGGWRGFEYYEKMIEG